MTFLILPIVVRKVCIHNTGTGLATLKGCLCHCLTVTNVTTNIIILTDSLTIRLILVKIAVILSLLISWELQLLFAYCSQVLKPSLKQFFWWPKQVKNLAKNSSYKLFWGWFFRRNNVNNVQPTNNDKDISYF